MMSMFPYPGLRPFERHETDIFFGREAHTDQLLERLGHRHFLAVVGPSGCGKSSLVRTGLLAGLETGFLVSAGARWRVAEMRLGNRPFARQSRRLIHGKRLRQCKIVNAYDPTIAPILKGKSHCPAQFGRKPGIIAEPTAGFIFAAHAPVGDPNDANYVLALVDKVQHALQRVSTP
jgi:energy-coupling factor transporter ATP-binding protein EcfA2